MGGGGSEVPTVPATSSKPSSSGSSTTPTPTSTTAKNDSDEEFEQVMKDSTYQSTRRNKEKPSVFARFKPSINLKGGDKPKPEPRQRKPKKKVYKYAAAMQANWDSLPQAMTLYNFRAEMRGDLEFRKGQVILVMTRTDSQNDWWEGRIEDRVGIFPANYVKML